MGEALGLGLGLGLGVRVRVRVRVTHLGEGAEVGGHEQHVRPRAQRGALQAGRHVDGDRAVGGRGEERKELALVHLVKVRVRVRVSVGFRVRVRVRVVLAVPAAWSRKASHAARSACSICCPSAHHTGGRSGIES